MPNKAPSLKRETDEIAATTMKSLFSAYQENVRPHTAQQTSKLFGLAWLDFMVHKLLYCGKEKIHSEIELIIY